MFLCGFFVLFFLMTVCVSLVKFGLSSLDDLYHSLRGTSSTALTIINLNVLWCMLFTHLNTYSFLTLAPYLHHLS